MYDKNLSLRPLDKENRQLLRLPIFSPKQPVPMLYQSSYKKTSKIENIRKEIRMRSSSAVKTILSLRPHFICFLGWSHLLTFTVV